MPNEGSWRTGELGEPVDPWEGSDTPPNVEFSTVGLTPVTPTTHKTVVDPGETVVDPGETAAGPSTAATERPQPNKRRRRPIVVVAWVVLVGTGGGTAWVLTPLHQPDDKQAAITPPASASSLSSAPAAIASAASGACQDATSWSVPAQQSWLKEVTVQPPAGSGTVRFEQAAADRQLCTGLQVTVDYWEIRVRDEGEDIRTFFDRFVYSVTHIRSTGMVIDGRQPRTVEQDGSWGPTPGCKGKAVTVSIGDPPDYSGYRGGANPMLGFRFPESEGLTMQSVVAPKQLHDCK